MLSKLGFLTMNQYKPLNLNDFFNKLKISEKLKEICSITHKISYVIVFIYSIYAQSAEIFVNPPSRNDVIRGRGGVCQIMTVDDREEGGGLAKL